MPLRLTTELRGLTSPIDHTIRRGLGTLIDTDTSLHRRYTFVRQSPDLHTHIPAIGCHAAIILFCTLHEPR